MGWFVQSLLLECPITPDLSSWCARSFLFGLIVCLSPAIYGFYLSLAGRSLPREELLEA